MSPGPSFIVVARTAVAGSRGQGVLAALGMGLGGSFFALAALFGLQLVLLAVPSIYRALQLLGALYLIFLAYRLWRAAPDPLDLGIGAAAAAQGSGLQAFVLGLATQLSNPKTTIVYASVFSAALRRTRLLERQGARLLYSRKALDRSSCGRRHGLAGREDPCGSPSQLRSAAQTA